jgi:hypothetical protein
MRKCSKTLLASMAISVLGCAGADNSPSPSASMTIGQSDHGDDDDDDAPTTTLPTTGISASATNGDDPDTADVTGTHDGSESDTESTTTGESDSTTDDATSAVTSTDTGDTTGASASTTDDGTTSTDDATTDATTTGGCDHAPGVYGDCHNLGFAACMMASAVCLHDGADPPTIGVCTILDCVDACDCPAPPATGNAQVTCAPILPNNQTACILACGAATTCPDGMTCINNTFCAFN